MTHVLPVLKWANRCQGFKSGRDIYIVISDSYSYSLAIRISAIAILCLRAWVHAWLNVFMRACMKLVDEALQTSSSSTLPSSISEDCHTPTITTSPSELTYDELPMDTDNKQDKGLTHKQHNMHDFD